MMNYLSDNNKKIQFISVTCYLLAVLMLVQAVASLNADNIRALIAIIFFVLLYQAGVGMNKRRKTARRLAIGLLLFFSVISSAVLIDMLLKVTSAIASQNSLIGLLVFSVVGFTTTMSVLHLFSKSVKDEFL